MVFYIIDAYEWDNSFRKKNCKYGKLQLVVKKVVSSPIYVIKEEVKNGINPYPANVENMVSS